MIKKSIHPAFVACNSDSCTPKSAWYAPAVQALLIQVLSCLVVLLAIYGISTLTLTDIPLKIPAIALLQGVIAAVLSRWRGLAPWWAYIQFLFPIAAIMMHSLHLPPTVFLAAFSILLSLYWTTFRTQVPFYPSGPMVWEAVADLLPSDRSIRFIDIGSGFGGLILDLAKRRPESDFIGIESAPLPWFASWLRTLMKRRGRFIRGDYDDVDLACYDVVFAYLSPVAMPVLWEKAKAQMRPGTLLLSYEFLIPDAKPDIVIVPETNAPNLYGWYL